MWWWILCVNLTRPWNPSIWSNILDVAVRVFWRIRLIFKSVGSKSGRLPFIIRVSLIQSAAGLNTMKTDLPGERRNSAHWQPMEMKCSISSSLGLQPASLPCRFHSCQLPQLSEPIPANKSLLLYLYLLLLFSCLSHVWLSLWPPWTLSCQATLSIGFPRQEYRRELPFLSPGHLPDPMIKPRYLAWQVDSLPWNQTG